MIPFPPQSEWLNTQPIKMEDLRGKFVIIDFWTYCCINCIHVLPELKKLEHAYPNELVVIGCHSAKFDTEKDTKNISEAILRYEIEHPVFNDVDMRFWRSIGVRSWPTVLMLDPEGKAVWMHSGEVQFEQVDAILKRALPYYRHKKLVDAAPIRFELLEYTAEETPLRFPGKVMADEDGKRLFITDSNHNRIVVTTLKGELLQTIGSGALGKKDGSFAESSFHHPQGVALHGDTLYIADTENHMLRKADLKAKTVTTIAGSGRQSRTPWIGWSQFGEEEPAIPGKPWHGVPAESELNSPWSLWVHGEHLYIAMAGPHQIWWMDLKETAIGPFAGNGREDIVDGPHMPREPYAQGASSFAQPSGLSSDGEWLYVADSEGSSIRAVPFDTRKKVFTIVGTAELPGGRLFEFGDRDGNRDEARLQHPLEVVYHDGQIYVADTYNDKIKRVDVETGDTRTVELKTDDEKPLDEPTGLAYAAGKLYVADTNNHRIRTIDLSNGELKTLEIAGLEPPLAVAPQRPTFEGKPTVLPVANVVAKDGQIKLRLKLSLPTGWKVNDLAPQRYWLSEAGDADLIPASAEGMSELESPSADVEVSVAVKGESGKSRVEVLMPYFYCEKEGGLCKMGSVQWELPLEWSAEGAAAAELKHSIEIFQFKPLP
jgi:thiol-disulfide isomerase/thioredoxin